MKVPKKQNVNQKVDSTNKSRSMVVLPYVQGVSECVARVYKSYDIAAAMKPQNTLCKELVHPKDKRDPENITDATWVSLCEFGIRLEEHKTEVEKVCKKVITRAGRKKSLTNTHKSAITNYVIGWEEARVIVTETDRYKRWVKEAIEIRKRGSTTMNRDEGQYHLSHIYDELLLNKNLPIRKSTGNSKTSKNQRSSRRAQCHPGVDRRNRFFWNVHHTQVRSILFGSKNMKYICWFICRSW